VLTWPPPGRWALWQTPCLAGLAAVPDGVIDCVVTSPPYNLGASPSAREHPHSRRGSGLHWRGYGADADALPEPDYQAGQRALLAALWRVCADGASLFYIHTDRLWAGAAISPWQWLAAGPWTIRQQICWDQGRTHQHNGRYFAPVHEYVFWLTKGPWPGQLGRLAPLGSVWRIPPARCPWHPAPFPEPLAARCVLAGAPPDGWVLDPYAGSASTGAAALAAGRRFLGMEQQAAYIAPARRRLRDVTPAPRWQAGQLPLPLAG
jgi:DNA modification methylase